jgi:hypothetical protein
LFAAGVDAQNFPYYCRVVASGSRILPGVGSLSGSPP